jgi:antitoxin (DNA-binding transcriptional repressor) of toxin-antitoxin stability system
MPVTYNMPEAKTHFSRLAGRAATGEVILIARDAEGHGD